MTTIAWGKAKVQVFALKKEIIALVYSGATYCEAYRKLADRLTVGESTFRRHAATIIKEKTRIDGSKPLSPELVHRVAQHTFGTSPNSAPPPPSVTRTSPDSSARPTSAGTVGRAHGKTIITETQLKKTGFAAGLHKSPEEIAALLKRKEPT